MLPDEFIISLLVLRANNVPKIAKRYRLKEQFYVTVTDQAITTTKKTGNVSIKGQTVEWNQKFDAWYDRTIAFCPV